MWSEYDETVEQVIEEPEDDGTALKTDYQDIIVSDVRSHNGTLTFSIQILNTEGTSSDHPI